MRKVNYMTSDGITTSYAQAQGKPHFTFLTDIKEEMTEKDRERAEKHMKKFGFGVDR